MVRPRNIFSLLTPLSAFFIFIIVNDVSLAQPPWPDKIQTIIKQTKPLQHSRGSRLPLYLWPAIDPGRLDQPQADKLIKLLNDRGIGVICSWNRRNPEESFASALPIAKAQKKLGLRINIDATSCMYSFYDGKTETSHIDNENNLLIEISAYID